MTTFDDEQLQHVALDEALADLKISRKLCRQLRAALRLEDDLFASAARRWHDDTSSAETAISRLLPDATAAEVLERLAVAAAVLDSVGKRHQSAGQPSNHSTGRRWGGGKNFKSKRCDDAPEVAEGGPAQEEPRFRSAVLAAIRVRLPRLSGTSVGQQERSRALRRRLRLLLPQESADLLTKELPSRLRVNGPDWASSYLDEAWGALKQRSDVEDLLLEIICCQTDPDVQRAFRSALPNDFPEASLVATVPDDRCVEVSAKSSCSQSRPCFSLLALPDAQILQVLSCSASAQEICIAAATCASIRELTDSDDLWKLAWRQDRASSRLQIPDVSVRAALLCRLASRCIECWQPTPYEHAIVGCRLCEQCERSCPTYVLVRAHIAMTEFQLSQHQIRSLPHLDGATGRVYLRSSLVSLAEKVHPGTSLQRLRAKRDVGVSAEGRQRKQRVQRGSGRGGQGPTLPRSMSRNEPDPCCFEATALIRASEIVIEDWTGVMANRTA
jgi:ferredoxin